MRTDLGFCRSKDRDNDIAFIKQAGQCGLFRGGVVMFSDFLETVRNPEDVEKVLLRVACLSLATLVKLIWKLG